ncbi:hypothetical protein ACSZM6_21430, partial [Aeromonas caviae]|uniref:hypothetical protein n=1 Tax=Aeromonas caviae TaxID=648 RepID=UPI003EC566FF
TTPSEVEWQDARLDTYRCRDAKSGAARETRAGAKRGCLKQLCATTILKNAGACTSFFTTISASYETHWPKVIAAFNEKVNTDSDVEHAISAGVSVFDDLVLISKRLPV